MLMEEMFEKLQKYQEILTRRVVLEREVQSMPRTLEVQREMLSKLKKTHQEIREDFERSEMLVREMRQGLEEAEQAREKAESMMDGITTQREYEAINKEIRDATEKEQNARKDIQKEERHFAEVEEELRKTENSMNVLEEEISEKKSKLDVERDVKNADIANLAEEEKLSTEGIDPDIIFKFERIIRNKEGMGIVPVHGVVCTGCHMILPANFVNEIRQANKVTFCPYCSRILFYEETEEGISQIGSDIESGSLLDLADYSDETEEESFEEDDEEEDQTEREGQEKEFPESARKSFSRRGGIQSETMSDDSDE
jgi:predicted  nucleic acid-binding Zn-ribbon protein